ncbi:CBS domain-containing protein [Candidatus Woesearchaeota archaeon]|nr:CBS domain-containing protein [Candidatus Woesearchaeota archaeon]
MESKLRNWGISMQTGYRVCDVMTRKPIAVTPETTIRECATVMKENNVSSLVVKEGDMLCGHITDDVLIRNVLAEGLDVDSTTAADVMLVKVATIEPKMDIYDALITMRDYETRQLPVVDKENSNKLVGLLTLKDILKIQPQLFDLLVDKIVLREEEQKLTSSRYPVEGTCDNCGQFFPKLYEVEGDFLCTKCSTSRKKFVSTIGF